MLYKKVYYKLIYIGTAEKGMVEVTNCFCVPHKESESQVEADLTYGIDLYELNHRVNAQENIVGWWATGNEVINILKNLILLSLFFNKNVEIILGYYSFFRYSWILCSWM